MTEVLTEDDALATAVKLIQVAGDEANVIAYQTAGLFVSLSIAVSLKRLADQGEATLLLNTKGDKK